MILAFVPLRHYIDHLQLCFVVFPIRVHLQREKRTKFNGCEIWSKSNILMREKDLEDVEVKSNHRKAMVDGDLLRKEQLSRKNA